MSTGTAIALSVVLLAANAFFVGAEFALVSARRTAIEPAAEAGNWAAKITLRAIENVSLMMAAAQLGITICSVGLGYLGEPAIAHVIEGPLETVGVSDDLLHPIAFAIALSIVTFLHVVLGEMVPKNLALAGPDRAALVLGPPLAFVVRAMRPAIALLNALANATLRLAGVTPQDEVTSTFTRDEVAGLVDESRREGLLDVEEERLLVGALKFEERDTRSVLIDMRDLVTARDTVTPAEFEQLAARTGYSRFPICHDGEMIGYLHLKDALEFKDAHRNGSIDRSCVRPLPTIRHDERLRSILTTMQESGAHLARVVGDDGSTAGVVALEDVLEELVGEIRDEAGHTSRTRRRSTA